MRFNALTIAGTDPSGGAGIQADLKTFSALGVYGTTVITALVAQNTCGVSAVYDLSPDFIAAQLDSVLSDVRIDSVKIGMLSNMSIIDVVCQKLHQYAIPHVVLDTVMVAKSGDPLLQPDAVDNMRTQLLPLVDLITPNLPEAAVLLGCTMATDEQTMKQQGYALLKKGCKAVLMKGGHLVHSESPDWLLTEDGEWRFTSKRIETKNTHGTGCTLSAALAAIRPQVTDWHICVEQAKLYLQQAIEYADSLEVGQGFGPVHHFHRWW
ncbi:bifunctional hydroxymethylpyrimidine kinase/phosphomethylpyrimidine kinase [Proteus myxofaciens]|uniref:hydroxymethylpyrimidine kinase n=1 Tax=Proteus myxofaciens ATCC 19692 TaxID=1354337 RepID=A0A198GIK9_9GAMM|nr:bifunctional hydroxymethylpyrimidine kinase/phosphomethylpyrimidine kinase [Proteus myxofaciens]OAT37277.1 hydroxymethylpyrimidine phosphate kinase [Proteus myxofaciens ATCC 19692]